MFSSRQCQTVSVDSVRLKVLGAECLVVDRAVSVDSVRLKALGAECLVVDRAAFLLGLVQRRVISGEVLSGTEIGVGGGGWGEGRGEEEGEL